MKKTALILALIMMLALLLVGCNADDGQTPAEPTPTVLPTLEELEELNSFTEIFKTHENVYVHSVCTSTEPENSRVQDAVYFDGNGKVNYHIRDTSPTDGSMLEMVSRVGNAFYSDGSGMTYAFFEEGETYLLDIFLPVIFDSLPLGKAYVDGDQIVHHAYLIYEAEGEYDAIRYDTTYYFDKDTYLLMKVEYTKYDEQHVAAETVVSEFTYDVKLSDVFETTLYDNVCNSEKRIDLEIILGDKTYSFVATTDMSLMGVVDSEFYDFYTDAECTNPVDTLVDYEGTKSMTLYAKASYEEVRYTVTEEEWNAATVELNYTVELVGDGESSFIKHTADAMELSSTLIVFVDDKQYEIELENGEYIAYDVTLMDFWNGGMLETFVYDEFFYDEENCVYVYDGIEEVGTKWEVRFENGVLIYVDTITYEDGEPVRVDTQRYSDIGTTVIDIPEYTIYVEEEYRATVTKEEWELNVVRSNYTGTFYTMGEDYSFIAHPISTDGNAILLDGKTIVFEDDKMYLLEEVDGVWVATEWNAFPIYNTVVPGYLSFEDFEYSEIDKAYVQKTDNGTGWYYTVKFYEGVLTGVIVQRSLDPTDPGYLKFHGIAQIEFGGVEIEVPEFIFPEQEEVRYTVTEEEWNAAVVEPNYTVELIGDGESYFIKHTADAMELSSTIIIFIGDKQYQIKLEDGEYIAYDITYVDYWHGGMLESFIYDEFTYDEEKGVYYYDGIEEAGTKWEVRFENGVLLYVDTITYEDGEPVRVDTQRYTDIGTTVIVIPEYTIYVEEEVRTTVTEEEWNLNVERTNYTASFVTCNQAFEMATYSFATDGNAILFDGKIIVPVGDKMYMLEEVDGVWVGTEWNEYNIPRTLIPEGLTFADFEYSEEHGIYMQKTDNGTGWYYTVTFANGVMTHAYAQGSSNPDDPAYFDLCGVAQIEFGGVEIEVPEYVIPE